MTHFGNIPVCSVQNC